MINRSSLRASALLAVLVLTAAAGCSKQEDQDRPLADIVTKFDQKPKMAIQDENPGEKNNWFTLSPADGAEGVAAEKAYADLKLPTGQKIIVAVIDSGVDIKHEDLAGKIWTNEKEIANNGIDDDGNGYVDDVNGWNFLGSRGADGKVKQLEAETLEVTRELIRLKKKKASAPLSPEEQAYFEKITKAFDKERGDAQIALAASNELLAKLRAAYMPVEKDLGAFEQLTLVAVEKLAETDANREARKTLINLFTENKAPSVALVLRRISVAQTAIDQYTNESFNARAEIIGDDPENYDDHAYGNNSFEGIDASHGTHCAGIIGAVRGNGLGMDGVADNAIIMPIRAVPDGDERDKDIANAIRYAVNNGARVINMSFGKPFSPGKAAVDAAMLYAEEKNVVIVHSAGNSSLDLDANNAYPKRQTGPTGGGREVRGWVEVGASSSGRGEQLPAAFSNFGQRGVDFFAPGVRLWSTVPENKYASFSGTSMAGPVVAGTAALILGQKPSLTANEVRTLLRSTARVYDGLVVRLPGADPIQPTLFSRLSLTGGIVDAYAAVKRALAL